MLHQYACGMHQPLYLYPFGARRPLELLRHPLCEELQFEGRAVAGALNGDCALLRSRLERRDSVRALHSTEPHCAEGKQLQTAGLQGSWPVPLVCVQASGAGNSPPVTGGGGGGSNNFGPAYLRNITSPFQQQRQQLAQQAPGSLLFAELSTEASLVSRPSGMTGYSAADATGGAREAQALLVDGTQDAAATGATHGWGFHAPLTQAPAAHPPSPATLASTSPNTARGAAAGASHTGARWMSPQGSWAPTAAAHSSAPVPVPGAARGASSPQPPASLQPLQPLQPTASGSAASPPGPGLAPAPLYASSTWLRAAGAQEGMVFRGLRARGALVWGELGGELLSGWSLQGQPTYRGKAWAVLSKVASKAKQGEVSAAGALEAVRVP